MTGPTGPAGSGLTDGDKGDIVVSGGGTQLMIDSNAVTEADLNNSARILIFHPFLLMGG